MDYALLAILWIAFYLIQITATRSKLKRNLKLKSSRTKNWFLAAQLLLSFLLLLAVIGISLTIEGEAVFSKSTFSNYLAYLFATLGTILSFKAIKVLSLKKMIGIEPSEGFQKLIQYDLYDRIRHPFYTGILLLFLGYFLFSGSISSAVHLLAFFLAMPLLIMLEEKNLSEQFGEKFETYRSKVSPILPRL